MLIFPYVAHCSSKRIISIGFGIMSNMIDVLPNIIPNNTTTAGPIPDINPCLPPFPILFSTLYPGANHIQPLPIVLEILRSCNGSFGVQQVLCQCGEGPDFGAKAHVPVIGDFA